MFIRKKVIIGLQMAAVVVGGGAFNPANAEVVLEEILVTAQKRSENLQEVPISISAFSGDFIDDASIASIDDVSHLTPGLTMSRFNIAQPQIFIRGIGSTDDSAYGDQSVGVFIDEVYIGRAGGADLNMMDLERIEVLRGPQGTLYGKNVVGGAINVVTRKPTNDFSMKVSAGAGNYSYNTWRALVNGGLSDSVSGKLGISRSNRDGHSKSSLGGRLSDEDNVSAFGQLLIDTSDQSSLLLSFDYSRDRREGNSRDSFGEQFVFFPWFAPGSPFAASPASSDPYRNEKTVNGYQDRDVWGVSAKFSWESPLGEFISITSYRNSEFDFQEDFDGSDASLVINNVDEEADQFSQEFRLSNVSSDGRLNWLAGLYFYQEEVDRMDNNDFTGNDTAAFGTPSPVPGLSWGQFLPFLGQTGWGMAPFDIFFDQYNETTSYAVFGQLDYQISEALNISVGARYTVDSKDAKINGSGFDPTAGFLEAPYDVSVDETWEEFTPKVSIDYQLNEDTMIYFAYSQGFKSGGFNGSASSGSIAEQGFDPEEATQYEIGIKSMLFDNRVRANLTAFQIDYTDLQVFQLKNGAELVIDNAADAESKGVELEITAALTETLTLTASYAYLDAEYDKYITESGADYSGNNLTRSPENSYNLSLMKRFSLGGVGDLTLQADYSYQDEIFFNADNYRMPNGDILVGDDDHNLWDAYAILELANTGIEIKLWGKNLGDEEYRVHGIDGRGPFNLSQNAAVVWGMPRTYGISLTWNID